MKISKAVITAAARSQRTLPLQTLVDRDGVPKSLLEILIGEALLAGIEEVGVVVCPGDEDAYRTAAGEMAGSVRFLPQAEPRGYGHALFCAHGFTLEAPFLHMVGDHVYVSPGGGSARLLVESAEQQECDVSGVQPTRENLLPYFGAVGGQPVAGIRGLYTVEQVVEKPTPTQAEQKLTVPGLRAGHYLCFFGIHVFTPTVMALLAQACHDTEGSVALSPILNTLAGRERYLALEAPGRRYAVDARYGLLSAQMALALSGKDRDEVLAGLCELLALREMDPQSSSKQSAEMKGTRVD